MLKSFNNAIELSYSIANITDVNFLLQAHTNGIFYFVKKHNLN